MMKPQKRSLKKLHTDVFSEGGFLMKKQTKDILTTKDAVLADVFFIIYFSLCILGFGVNGTEVPSGVNLISIVLSAALAVGFGTKVLTDFDRIRS